MLKNSKWNYSPVMKAVIAACLIVFTDLGFAACSSRPETVTLQSAEEMQSAGDTAGLGGSLQWEAAGMAETASASPVLTSGQESGTAPASAASDSSGSAGTETGNLSEASGAQQAAIYVYVCGAVRNPGVYELEQDTRVFEAVAAAGGFTLEADETAVNQALVLADQDQLYIPTDTEMKTFETEGNASTPIGISRDAAGSAAQGTAAGLLSGTGQQSGTASMTAGTAGEGSAGSAVQLININTADQNELETLPGIGKTKAGAIIAYRQEKGAFSRIEELKNVSGIGDATFEKLKDLVTVN